MVAVRALADHAQTEIDFCRRSNLHAPLVNIAPLRLRRIALDDSRQRKILERGLAGCQRCRRDHSRKLAPAPLIDYKGPIDLVTSVDRAAEQSIVEVLQGEISRSIRSWRRKKPKVSAANCYRWIIDPLDGTTNFAHGYPQVSVSIALEFREQIIVGLVYDPLRRECFRAVKGQGATLNGAAIRISSVTNWTKRSSPPAFPTTSARTPISI